MDNGGFRECSLPSDHGVACYRSICGSPRSICCCPRNKLVRIKRNQQLKQLVHTYTHCANGKWKFQPTLWCLRFLKLQTRPPMVNLPTGGVIKEHLNLVPLSWNLLTTKSRSTLCVRHRVYPPVISLAGVCCSLQCT